MICIGGHYHGQDVPEQQEYLRFPAPFKATFGERFGLTINSQLAENLTYRKRTYQYCGQLAKVYVLEGLPDEEARQLILKECYDL